LYHIKNTNNKILKLKINRKDFIQLLIDAQDNESSFLLEDKSVDMKNINLNKKLSTDVNLNSKVTIKSKIKCFNYFKEIKMNLVLFMLAGYETTSTTLSYCTYVLAKFQDEQQKLYEEILSYFNSNNLTIDEINQMVNSETVNKLDYLDMFIKEVLRMYPIGNR
jgi:hypothetical protein